MVTTDGSLHEKKKYDSRYWEMKFDKWLESVQNNDDTHPRPGPHPDPDHWWNTNPEIADDIDRKTLCEGREFKYRKKKLEDAKKFIFSS